MINQFILDLYKVGAVKFGAFTLKSGIESPIYIDLRVIVSYPSLLRTIAGLLWEKASSLRFDYICGVPYTALPFATALSIKYTIPMVMRRKEAKDYGTKKIIEGDFKEGRQCLIVEDLITSGLSIFETITPLESAGLKIKDVIVLLDREQGGKKHLEKKGYALHSVLTLSNLLETLLEKEKITNHTFNEVHSFIAANQV